MFCDQCGSKVEESSQFCSHCGNKLQVEPAAADENSPTLEMETHDAAIETFQTNEALEQKQPRLVQLLPVLIPIFSLILVSIVLSFYYIKEKNINEDVLQLKESAEKTALDGNYEKAKNLLQQAVKERPDYTALTLNLAEVSKAIEFEEKIATVSDHIQKTEFDAASKELANVKQLLSEEEAPLFEPFHQYVQQKEVSITVGTIKKELNNLTTVDQLGGKLSLLASLPEEEASAVKQEILNKIVHISIDQAENKLAKKQFSEAFSTIDRGLQFAMNNEKLLALKSRVQQDQIAFEQAEQRRIEQAMEAAAQEDLKNKTAATEVTDLSVYLDEYGDLYITGTVKNVATTNIYSVTIYYSIYDESGVYLTDGSTSLYPYYLRPGDTGDFADTYYGVYENVQVEIDNITWYLD